MRQALAAFEPFPVVGRVIEAAGVVLRVAGLKARVGELCRLRDPGRLDERLGEVIGFAGPHALVTPFSGLQGLSRATEVRATGQGFSVGVGPGVLGRVLDGFGRPLDGLGEIQASEYRSVDTLPPQPMARRHIGKPLSTGVRTIDALLTLGEGQRLGIFAAAGVGKSSLVGMLARNTKADVIVVALVGERGREVGEFIRDNLPEATLARSVVVVATSDRPAMERAKCASVATTIAEYFRSLGRHVLLLVDSLTRFARAQREIGLAAGEPPTRRGYPPSLFTVLPLLVERAGTDMRGAITGMYTVLTEGEDVSDPVAEELRSLLDGHVILSQRVAAGGRYPAIDVLNSKSRLMSSLATPAHVKAAQRFLALQAKYAEIELLLQVGEFKRGEDAVADEAARKHADMHTFLAQSSREAPAFDASVAALNKLVAA
jgi:type III secretion protein N (ATPase)